METLYIAVMGCAGVGKSTLCIQFVQGHFVDFYDPTIEDKYRKVFDVKDTTYLLEIVDTAGAGVFETMQDLYIEKADGIILLFSLISPSTLDEAQYIYDTIVSVRGNTPPPIMLGGTKRDLWNRRQITFQEAYTQAQRWGCGYVEVSSKENVHVDHIFEILIQQICRDRDLMRTVSPVSPKKRHKRCTLF